MTKLLPTFFACMILAIISERCSIREEGKLEYLHKDKIFYFMIVVLMILLAGLRVRYIVDNKTNKNVIPTDFKCL